MKLVLFAVALLAFTLISARQVWAESTIRYTYTFGGDTFTWELPTNPVIAPGNAFPDDAGFRAETSLSPKMAYPWLAAWTFLNADSSGGFVLYLGCRPPCCRSTAQFP